MALKKYCTFAWQDLADLASPLVMFISDLVLNLPAFSYLFTKFDNQEQIEGVHSQLKDKFKNLKAHDMANKGFVALLEDMIKKTKTDTLAVDPLNGSASDILKSETQQPL